jgi:hypothetical protein
MGTVAARRRVPAGQRRGRPRQSLLHPREARPIRHQAKRRPRPEHGDGQPAGFGIRGHRMERRHRHRRRPPASFFKLEITFFSFLEYAGELRINVLTG